MSETWDEVGALVQRAFAAEAERDAAIAVIWLTPAALTEARRNGVAEGKRAATAAIVAWMRSLPSHRANRSTIAQIELGDHLKGPKP